MTNKAVRATAEGLPATFRTIAPARANQLATFLDRLMEPQALQSPDQRIADAIEEIKEAYREKWPDAPIYIRDLDRGDSGMVMIMTSVEDQPAGSMVHERVGKGWRTRGGERRSAEGGAS